MVFGQTSTTGKVVAGAVAVNTDDLLSRVENYENAALQSLGNAETSGIQFESSNDPNDLTIQQTCLMAATAYATMALVLRAKIANGGV